MKTLLKTGFLFGALAAFIAGGFAQQGNKTEIEFIPIAHASFVMVADSGTVYVDPTGDPADYGKFPAPDMILVTHDHTDHFDAKLIAALRRPGTAVVGSRKVIDALGYGEALGNGESTACGRMGVAAIPAYNTTPERRRYHPKGEGNGYVITAGSQRIYVSGDTEDVPEMRSLRHIDYAFVCMNRPYTMTVEQAASAVLEFKPKVVIPYHYRQENGSSDIGRFAQLAGGDRNIEIRHLKF